MGQGRSRGTREEPWDKGGREGVWINVQCIRYMLLPIVRTTCGLHAHVIDTGWCALLEFETQGCSRKSLRPKGVRVRA